MQTAYKTFAAFLLIIGGITAAVFGQSIENNLLFYAGLFVAVVGVVYFLIVKILDQFWRHRS